VRTASNANEAQRLLEEQEFDVVVADLQAPGNGEGMGLREWLEAKKPLLARHMVLMRATAPATGSGQDAALEGRPVLQKPFKAADLLALVDGVLAQIDAAPLKR
jgi:CheY-like chemotaxis protein